MRRSNSQPLGEVLREYVKALGMGKKLKEVHIVKSWEELLGKSIANKTKNIYIKDGILYVQVNSAVVKNELLLIKSEIIPRLNERVKEQIVKDIVIY